LNNEVKKQKDTFVENCNRIKHNEHQMVEKQARFELLKKQEHEISEQISKEQQNQSELTFKRNQLQNK